MRRRKVGRVKLRERSLATKNEESDIQRLVDMESGWSDVEESDGRLQDEARFRNFL